MKQITKLKNNKQLGTDEERDKDKNEDFRGKQQYDHLNQLPIVLKV